MLCWYMVGSLCPSAFTSTNTVRFSNLPCPAKAAASKLVPGHFSIAQHDVHPGRALIHFCADRQASSHRQSLPQRPRRGVHTQMRGVGWPSNSLENSRSVITRDSGKTPASANAAYSIGAACPFERNETITVENLDFCGQSSSRRKTCRLQAPPRTCKRSDIRSPPRSSTSWKESEPLRLLLNRINSRCRCPLAIVALKGPSLKINCRRTQGSGHFNPALRLNV